MVPFIGARFSQVEVAESLLACQLSTLPPELVILSTWPAGFPCPWVALKLRLRGDIPITGGAPGTGVGVGVPGPRFGVPGPGEAVSCPPEVDDENGDDDDKTINCTMTVCVRCPVKKTMKALYVPGKRFPTFTLTPAVGMLAWSKRPRVGVTVSQLTEVNTCQSMTSAQPAVAPRTRPWLAGLPRPAIAEKAKTPTFVVTPQRGCTVREATTG